MLPSPLTSSLLISLSYLNVVLADFQQCYFGAGASKRGPSNLVPCMGSGASACCLLGDTCLSGNTCYNAVTGDLYQYGCTDITYQDSTCPYKCGFNTSASFPYPRARSTNSLSSQQRYHHGRLSSSVKTSPT